MLNSRQRRIDFFSGILLKQRRSDVEALPATCAISSDCTAIFTPIPATSAPLQPLQMVADMNL
jgi:hypothetical protein